VDQAAHACERRLITVRFPATPVWTGCDLPGRAATPQQFFDKGLTDPKEGGDAGLRAKMLVTRPKDFLSKVEGVGFHALEISSFPPVYAIDKRCSTSLWCDMVRSAATAAAPLAVCTTPWWS
jgi:hypothetical protein